MADWLVLDETLRLEWEREASRRVSRICGGNVSVAITLPTVTEARAAYTGNTNLYGNIRWSDGKGHAHGVYEPLPFHGVFILNSPGDRHAQAAVWNAYLEPLPAGMSGEERDAVRDDLARRRLRTFPRQLLERLCGKMEAAFRAGRLFDESYWERACFVPVGTWLDTPSSLVRRVFPNNASDLMAQVCGVTRYVVSRDKAMGYASTRRMNHPSFDGRLCPVDTPESEMVGISLQLARGAWVDRDGLIHPARSKQVADRREEPAPGDAGPGTRDSRREDGRRGAVGGGDGAAHGGGGLPGEPGWRQDRHRDGVRPACRLHAVERLERR